VFERGLPGYDDWLDNHGNPGIWEDAMYPRWAIEEQIDVTQVAENPDVYAIDRVNGTGSFRISFGAKSADPDKVDERRLLINGEDVDLGDDFIEFISILDDYNEQGGGGLGQTIRQRPFQDGDDADH
jgi:hypothetical protein